MKTATPPSYTCHHTHLPGGVSFLHRIGRLGGGFSASHVRETGGKRGRQAARRTTGTRRGPPMRQPTHSATTTVKGERAARGVTRKSRTTPLFQSSVRGARFDASASHAAAAQMDDEYADDAEWATDGSTTDAPHMDAPLHDAHVSDSSHAHGLVGGEAGPTKKRPLIGSSGTTHAADHRSNNTNNAAAPTSHRSSHHHSSGGGRGLSAADKHAIRACKRVIKGESGADGPLSSAPFSELGRIYTRVGDRTSAFRVIEDGLARFPNEPEFRTLLQTLNQGAAADATADAKDDNANAHEEEKTQASSPSRHRTHKKHAARVDDSAGAGDDTVAPQQPPPPSSMRAPPALLPLAFGSRTERYKSTRANPPSGSLSARPAAVVPNGSPAAPSPGRSASQVVAGTRTNLAAIRRDAARLVAWQASPPPANHRSSRRAGPSVGSPLAPLAPPTAAVAKSTFWSPPFDAPAASHAHHPRLSAIPAPTYAHVPPRAYPTNGHVQALVHVPAPPSVPAPSPPRGAQQAAPRPPPHARSARGAAAAAGPLIEPLATHASPPRHPPLPQSPPPPPPLMLALAVAESGATPPILTREPSPASIRTTLLKKRISSRRASGGAIDDAGVNTSISNGGGATPHDATSPTSATSPLSTHSGAASPSSTSSQTDPERAAARRQALRESATRRAEAQAAAAAQREAAERLVVEATTARAAAEADRERESRHLSEARAEIERLRRELERRAAKDHEAQTEAEARDMDRLLAMAEKMDEIDGKSEQTTTTTTTTVVTAPPKVEQKTAASSPTAAAAATAGVASTSLEDAYVDDTEFDFAPPEEPTWDQPLSQPAQETVATTVTDAAAAATTDPSSQPRSKKAKRPRPPPPAVDDNFEIGPSAHQHAAALRIQSLVRGRAARRSKVVTQARHAKKTSRSNDAITANTAADAVTVHDSSATVVSMISMAEAAPATPVDSLSTLLAHPSVHALFLCGGPASGVSGQALVASEDSSLAPATTRHIDLAKLLAPYRHKAKRGGGGAVVRGALPQDGLSTSEQQTLLAAVTATRSPRATTGRVAPAAAAAELPHDILVSLWEHAMLREWTAHCVAHGSIVAAASAATATDVPTLTKKPFPPPPTVLDADALYDPSSPSSPVMTRDPSLLLPPTLQPLPPQLVFLIDGFPVTSPARAAWRARADGRATETVWLQCGSEALGARLADQMDQPDDARASLDYYKSTTKPALEALANDTADGERVYTIDAERAPEEVARTLRELLQGMMRVEQPLRA